MKIKVRPSLFLALGLLLALSIGAVHVSSATWESEPRASAIGTQFTYQGHLADGGSPADVEYDLRFDLYDAEGNGNLLGTVSRENVGVSDGFLTVLLDFGSNVFTGQARWLEIGVRPGASTGDHTMLTPRQSLTPAPYALALPGLWIQQTTISPNLIGGSGENSVGAGVVGAIIAGGGQPGWPNQVTADFGTVGGGDTNVVSEQYGSIGGGGNNSAAGLASMIGGGGLNAAEADYATVSGGRGNRASGQHATIGGGVENTASHYQATVCGGRENTADGHSAFVGGGVGNTASGDGPVVVGGFENTATGDSVTVGGGFSNLAQGTFATVGGGGNNLANAEAATVPGGAGAAASHYGELAYASGPFNPPDVGNAQTSVYVLRTTTTDSIHHELFLDGLSERITVAPNRTVVWDVWLVGRSDGGESAGYHMWGVLENVAGTTRSLGDDVSNLGEDDTLWDAMSLADDVNDALVVVARGNGETIRWVATVRTVEVAW